MKEQYILEMTGICKSFLAVKALQDVDFKVRPGEVHALMGENGAGKSTLIKILTGIYGKDSGEILFNGAPISPKTALEAQKLGISTIYQELNLIPYLSIAENIYLGREPKKMGLIDWPTIKRNARTILKEQLGLDVDVNMTLDACSTAISQMTALARAISIDAKLVVMDEPTSSLEDAEVKILFGAIRRLKEKGIAVIYITHKLDEMFEICDTVTILKDGQFAGSKPVSEITKLELVSAMIGRDATGILEYKKQYRDLSANPVVCRAMHLSSGKLVKNVNLEVRRGEVVGLAGLLSSGRTESAKIIFGADPMGAGDVEIDGRMTAFRIPKDAIDIGLGFCSEDRKTEGIMPHMTVKENMNMAIMPKIARRGLINDKKGDEIVREYIDKLNIKTPSEHQLIRNLSGGNQQKVLLGRWMCMHPDLLILDEPTRGIDVGAKSEIEALIQQLAEAGVGVIYISSEIEELIRGCDRILVLREGTNIAELKGEEISEDRLMEAMAKSEEPAQALEERGA